MVDSIDAVTKGGAIRYAIAFQEAEVSGRLGIYSGSSISNLRDSEEFVGLILLPLVGNAAEHFTAVTVAIVRINLEFFLFFFLFFFLLLFWVVSGVERLLRLPRQRSRIPKEDKN